jgi:outer membrane protein OmpA-like peptidoglycan-associated protein
MNHRFVTRAQIDGPDTRIRQRAPSAGGFAEAVLALQRAAGNASVGRLVAATDRAAPAIQRQALPGSGGGPLPGSGGPLPASTTTDERLAGFATDSAELTPEHRSALDRVAAQLNAEPLRLGGYVTLVGHADRRGTDPDNLALGQRRAEAVRDHLRQLVTDEETGQQIRAYSLGAPAQGPVTDDPGLRAVNLTITRRRYDVPTPSLTLPGPDAAPAAPPVLDFSRPVPGDLVPPGPGPRVPPGSVAPEPGPQLPDWFWHATPPHRTPQPAPLHEISQALNDHLGAKHVAWFAARVAGAFGVDRAEAERFLRKAMIDGGEAGLKAVLEKMVKAAAGSPAGPGTYPYGPPVSESASPDIYRAPQIPLP